jgi:redox-sensing transcriptional repressor
MIRNRIPDVVVKRLVTYLRVLRDATLEGGYISSAQLGDLAAVNGAQVRKDLALFGEFGKQGVGYPIKELTEEITRILGADREIPVALFGVGELGTAIVRYLSARRRFDPTYRFIVGALFDEDRRKIGNKLEGISINALSELGKLCPPGEVKIGILTVPALAAQEVVEKAVAHGIRGFLNFAPVKLRVPPGVRVQQADVTLELQELAFYV